MQFYRLTPLWIVWLFLSFPAFAQTDSSIAVRLSPKGGATDAIINLIAEAHQSIRVAAYSFTSKDIAEALIAAHDHGIDVKVVLDKSNVTARYSKAGLIAGAGIPVRIDYEYAIMHNKFMIVDNVTVETGSFNYTKAAEQKNAENVIILHGQPDVAKQYRDNWQKLWEESEEY